ncbi:hypothetical protein CR513_13063, partial [Mucuna pruriens]
MSPYRIVFSKAYHLLVEIEHRAYWAINPKNWTNSAWKPMRNLGSISRKSNSKERVPSQPESKLHSRWDGPFVITNIFPYGVVQLRDEHTNSTFQLFHEGPAPIAGDMETISLMEPSLPDDTY